MNRINPVRQCVQELEKIRLDDPLRTVYCLVPSLGYLRCLQREIFESGKAFAGLHVRTFGGLVRQALEMELALSGTRYVNQLDIHAMFRDIMSKTTLEWCGHAVMFDVMPGLVARALTKMRLNHRDGNIKIPAGFPGPKGKDLLALHDAYEKRKKSENLADYADVVRLFLSRYSRIDMDKDAAIILMPDVMEGMSMAEKRCIEKLRNDHQVIDIEMDEPNPGEVYMDFFTAPYDTLEAREVATRVLELVHSGECVFEDVAVICPDAHYLSLLADELKWSGIPFWAPGGIPTGNTGGMAVLEALLDVIRGDFDFQDVKRYLLRCSGVPWKSKEDDETKFSRLHLLRMARVHGAASGSDAWMRHLAYALENAGDNMGEHDRTHLDALREFVERLMPFREKLLESAGSTIHATRLRELVEQFLPGGKAKSRLHALLDLLSRAPGNVMMTGEEFTTFVGELAGGYREPAGTPGGSVYLTDRMNDGIFPHVFVPGMTESAVPGIIRQDPVLNDSDIEILNENPDFTIETAGEKRTRLTKMYSRFVGRAAASWTGSAPGMEVMEGKVVFPTPLLSGIYSKISKQAYTPAGLDEFMKQRSVRSLILDGEGTLSLHGWEYETSRILHDRSSASHFFSVNGAAARAYESERARWAMNEFTSHTGITGKNEYNENAHFSATAAVTAVQCPYRYYLERIAGLKPLEEPVPVEDIDAMQMGTIVHEILEKFMKRVTADNISRNSYDETMEEIRDGVLGDFLRHNECRYRVMWEKRKAQLNTYLENFLEYEKTNQACPGHFELSFGMDGEEPVVLRFGDMDLSLRGKIDRVDERDGEFMVIDYKTSSKQRYSTGTLDGGLRIQPFIYAEAFKKKTGRDNISVKAGFFPLRDGKRPILWNHDQLAMEQLDVIFRFIRGVLEGGMFFPTGDCEYCNFTPVCSNYVAYHVERKLQGNDELLVNYRMVREME